MLIVLEWKTKGKHWLVHCFLDKCETLLLNKTNLESMIKTYAIMA